MQSPAVTVSRYLNAPTGEREDGGWLVDRRSQRLSKRMAKKLLIKVSTVVDNCDCSVHFSGSIKPKTINTKIPKIVPDDNTSPVFSS